MQLVSELLSCYNKAIYLAALFRELYSIAISASQSSKVENIWNIYIKFKQRTTIFDEQ